MHHTTRRTHREHRTNRPSLSPYVLDEVGLTLSEVRKAREEADAASSL